MEKRDYIQPKIKVLDICGRRNILDGIPVGGMVTSGENIGWSKRNNLFDEEDEDFHYNVWEH